MRKRLRGIWHGMRSRCLNPKCQNFPRYGGRGISICSEWNEFEVFYAWAVEHGYQPHLSIDREDNDGNYEPENCRWITRGKNAARNRTKKPLPLFSDLLRRMEPTAVEVAAIVTEKTTIPTSPRTVENWRIGRFLPPPWKQREVLTALSQKII